METIDKEVYTKCPHKIVTELKEWRKLKFIESAQQEMVAQYFECGDCGRFLAKSEFVEGLYANDNDN